MNLNDLFLSYKQVEAPSFYEESDIIPSQVIPITKDVERIQQLELPRFTGWTYSDAAKPITSNDIDIVNYFMDKGLTRNQALGIYGNLMHESGGGNLDALSKDGHNSYGLAQWTGDRKLRLFSKYGRHPNKQQQLDFLWEELNSSEKPALQALLKTNSIEDATKVFMNKFERPNASKAGFVSRLKFAYSKANG